MSEALLPVGDTGESLRTIDRVARGLDEVVVLADTDNPDLSSKFTTTAPAAADPGLVVRVAGNVPITGGGTYAGAAGTGTDTVDVPSGMWVKSWSFQAGTSNATASVPNITGTVTAVGSSTVQTAVSDVLLPGELIGPCTFTFTNTAAFMVTWSDPP